MGSEMCIRDRANGRFCEFAIRGANAGMEFGLSDGVDLRLINDFDWLRQRFHMDEMNDTI